MARTSSFWGWHASVNDSVRHSIVEQGWFGRQTTQDINSDDMPALSGRQEEAAETDLSQNSDERFEAVYGQRMDQEQEQEL